MHNIMHDYIDSTCKHILEQIKPAMTPGYSKILINDLVLPAKDAHWLTTALDIELMMCLASRERTEKEFRDLIDSAGLKVEGIWSKFYLFALGTYLLPYVCYFFPLSNLLHFDL